VGPAVKLGWLTEIASPDLARKKKLKKAASHKLQAASLTACPRDDRIISMTSFGAFPVDKFAKAPQQWKEI